MSETGNSSSQLPAKAAREAGLRYVSDSKPGIRRVRHGQGFAYVNSRGKPVRDTEALARIKAIVIPPAWTDVWICGEANGHLQACGRDARGRKQYRYHHHWRRVRDESKYDRLLAFGKALGKIRKRVKRDLRRKGLPREKVLATVVRLLETTLVRVGNDEYARNNRSYGLTTLHDHHTQVNGSQVKFRFRGKSGIEREAETEDPRLARIVRRCKDLPGQELFQYKDGDGTVHDVNSADVNDYLRSIAGEEFTAKDFRTWAGTVLAAQVLQEFRSFDSKAEAKRHIVRAIEHVAKRLGNTTTVCRKCYVHPAVLDAYLDGGLVKLLKRKVEKELRQSLTSLAPEEAAVLAFLRKKLEDQKSEVRSQRSEVRKRFSL